MTALDASFLRVETPAAHMHVAWKARFQPPADRPASAPITLDLVRRQAASRLHLAPRFRQRVAFPPGGFSGPLWVDDEDFDLRRHVVALAGEDEILHRDRFDERADRALSEPLDRRHALWRMYVAPRLHDGTTGVVMKVHHSMVDGKSALALALLLLDVDPDAPPPPADPPGWSPEPAPGAARMAVEGLVARGTEPLRAAAELGRLARSPARRGRLTETLRRTALAVGEDVARPAPNSYMNVGISRTRVLVGHTTSLPALLEVRRARGATLNDVVLAAVAGALRELALGRRTRPEALKVMVPVSQRSAEEEGALGNRIAFVFIDLPVHLRRPADRIAAIHEQTRAFKETGRASGGEAILGALGFLPGPLQAQAARFAGSPRMYNLVVSNVPGPRFPVYLLGAECVEALPVVPLSEGHALSIGAFSFDRRLCISAYFDPTVLPEGRELPLALNSAILELTRATARRSPRRAPALAGR